MKNRQEKKTIITQNQYGRICEVLLPTDVGVSVIPEWLFMHSTKELYRSGDSEPENSEKKGYQYHEENMIIIIVIIECLEIKKKNRKKIH